MDYEFVRGPLLWAASAVFVAGALYRLASALRGSAKKAPAASARLIPFSMPEIAAHPVMALVSVIFHVCLLLTPLFIIGHAVSWHESWGIRWWSLPEGVATIMTLVVVVGGLFFALQWMTVPEVKRVIGGSDWFLLLLAVTPFASGFLAHQQVLPYKAMLILHIVSGAAWLVLIPFTRLFQLLWFGFSRAYMAAEFRGGSNRTNS